MNTSLLFDFSKHSNIENWTTVNDVVMGGMSQSNFRYNSNGKGVFAGKVSLENNGGFSLLRGRIDVVEINTYKFIKLYLKGDNKKYQFRVKSSITDNFAFKTTFLTSNRDEIIKISIKDLVPYYRGRKVLEPVSLNNRIEEIGFLIANKENEEFELQISKIELSKI
ncbi:Complex I intermediate-associated protein 30 (CIA30) [Lutibacter oricola]|uniref:Complex I intermediate-associated protein 30 (CIA30) n=1 Tax=Lutibacter oricola TaxID=762486 RepID=A0A1H3AA52_9FLAO|nr:CIA30 family protein [Lutibacter oricola]SDX26168.1 Complex I intermediate-associated protein 30 (CIA30) [Lutibacter oricola]